MIAKPSIGVFATLIVFTAAITNLAGPPWSQANAQSQENEALAPITETIDATAPPIGEDQQLAAIENYLNSISTLSGRFAQQGPDGQITRGKIYLERPGRIRFEYDSNDSILIVSDGSTLNLIDYDIGEITRWPINDTPLALLLAESTQFSPDGTADLVSITAEDPKNPAQGALTLIFTNDTANKDGEFFYQLRAWQVVDAQGGLTTVSLAETLLNQDIDPAHWTFTDPRSERMRRRTRR